MYYFMHEDDLSYETDLFKNTHEEKVNQTMWVVLNNNVRDKYGNILIYSKYENRDEAMAEVNYLNGGTNVKRLEDILLEIRDTLRSR